MQTEIVLIHSMADILDEITKSEACLFGIADRVAKVLNINKHDAADAETPLSRKEQIKMLYKEVEKKLEECSMGVMYALVKDVEAVNMNMKFKDVIKEMSAKAQCRFEAFNLLREAEKSLFCNNIVEQIANVKYNLKDLEMISHIVKLSDEGLGGYENMITEQDKVKYIAARLQLGHEIEHCRGKDRESLIALKNKHNFSLKEKHNEIKK